MALSSNYNFEIVPYGNQGTKITLRKKQSLLQISVLLSLCALDICTFLFNQGRPPGQNYFLLISVGFTASFIIYSLTNIQTESLLILSAIGVTVKQSSILTSTSRYFDIQQIQDIVIVEAISMHQVVCEMVLLPRNKQTSEKGRRKMYPLFKSFRPKLQDLKTIYRHVQEKLMIPSEHHDR